MLLKFSAQCPSTLSSSIAPQTGKGRPEVQGHAPSYEQSWGWKPGLPNNKTVLSLHNSALGDCHLVSRCLVSAPKYFQMEKKKNLLIPGVQQRSLGKMFLVHPGWELCPLLPDPRWASVPLWTSVSHLCHGKDKTVAHSTFQYKVSWPSFFFTHSFINYLLSSLCQAWRYGDTRYLL